LKKVTKRYKNILFRADSSSKIGLGHIMRDLVLAKEFKDAKVFFSCQNLEGNIIDKIPYETIILKSNDIDELIEIIDKNDIDLLVIDHYDIKYEDEKEIKDKTDVKILSFDDTYERHYCDILLNHNIHAKKRKYKNLVPSFCKIKCGKKYTLIRDEFKKVKRQKRVFVAMGGADTTNLNIKILKVLKKFKNIKIDVITTSANQNLQKLKNYIEEKKNIKLHIDSKKIAKLIKRSDFAITTPSVMVHEILYMNTPFIAIKSADNQKDIYKYLKKNSYLVMREFDENILFKMTLKMLDRIEFNLVNFYDLTLDEKLMVLKWRNHKDVRRWMLTKEKIDKKSHLNFISSLRSKEDRVYLLVKRYDIPVGVIDFTDIDKKDKSASFGIYANPDLVGEGRGLMRCVKSYAFDTLGLKKIKATVYKSNAKAIKLYQNENFKTLKSDLSGMLKMELVHEDR
jgi:UDP-2,4-diacetamido-2,4,6-trideoxy-beta-L-altropyranose hydrolase/UDP-4-amino-4,6-dideoxy-N-acetyl-beta-L-altrosamine N-acetyltransferase